MIASLVTFETLECAQGTCKRVRGSCRAEEPIVSSTPSSAHSAAMLCQRASNSACVRGSRQQAPVVANSSRPSLRFSSRCICKAGSRVEDDDLLLSVGCPVPTEQQPMNEVRSKHPTARSSNRSDTDHPDSQALQQIATFPS